MFDELTLFSQGIIQQLRGQNFEIFCLPPLSGQKQAFYDPLPPPLVRIVIEWPPRQEDI